MSHLESARLAPEAKSPMPKKQDVNIVLVDLFVALTAMHFQVALLRRLFVQASCSMPHLDNARLALKEKLPRPRKQGVSIVPVDLYVALTEMLFQVVFLRRLFAQASCSMPHLDNARLALKAKLPRPRKQGVSIVKADLYEALTEMLFQVAFLRRPLAQASCSMPHLDSARLVPEARLPRPRKQAVNIVPADLSVALTEMRFRVVLLRRKFAQKRSMPHSDNARLAPMAKSATAREHNVFKLFFHDIHEVMMTKQILL